MLVLEIRVLEALIGGTTSFPLLGGHETSLEIDDVIYPGYVKILTGQGMPKQNETGIRRELRIIFLVEFRESLTPE